MADKKTLSVLILGIDGLSPTLKSINRTVRTFKKSLRDIGSASEKISQKLGVPVSLFGLSALGGIGATMTGFAEKAADTSNALTKIGGNAQDLQVFRKAAELAHIPIEVMDKGLEKLNKNLGEAGGGKNKEFAAMMTKLKIPLRNANLEMRTAGEILPELADAFKKNGNAAMRGRIGAVAFGQKMGSKLIPMMVKGSASFIETREHLERLGAVMSDTALKDGTALEHQLTWLKIAGRGLGMTIGATLAPVLTPLLKDLEGWIAANRKLVASKVTAFVEKLGKEIKKINWEKIGTTLDKIGEGVGKAVKFFGGWGNAMIVVALILNGPLIAAVVSLGLALARLIPFILLVARGFMGLLLATGAIGLIIAAVALLAMIIYKEWGPITEFVSNLWSKINRIFVDNIADLIMTIVPFAAILDKISGGKITASINAAVGNTPEARAAREKESSIKAANDYSDGVGNSRPSLLNALVGQQQLRGSTDGVGNSRPSLLNAAAAAAAGQQQLRGSIDININGAPPGTRVSEGKTNSPRFSLNPDVGYNWATTGIP